MRVLVPFVAEGLSRGEKCFLAQKQSTAQNLLYDLQFIGIDTEEKIQSGALEFHSEQEVYFPNGEFNVKALMAMLKQSIRDAVRLGFTGFRSAGDLSWAVEGRNECTQLIGYEEMVKKAYPGKPATGLCQYPIDAFPPDVLTRILEAHEMNIVDPPRPSLFGSIGIQSEACSAEIVADRFVLNPSYAYVVERHYPNEILGWGTAPDFQSAKRKAEEVMGIGVA